MDKLFHLARNLRQTSTRQERILWKLLRNRGFYNLKFKRQVPIGDYIVDFLCEEKKLIIELDGGQHNIPNKVLNDEKRTKFLEDEGYQVIRFWNNDIDKNIGGVYEKLKEVLKV